MGCQNTLKSGGTKAAVKVMMGHQRATKKKLKNGGIEAAEKLQGVTVKHSCYWESDDGPVKSTHVRLHKSRCQNDDELVEINYAQ